MEERADTEERTWVTFDRDGKQLWFREIEVEPGAEDLAKCMAVHLETRILKRWRTDPIAVQDEMARYEAKIQDSIEVGTHVQLNTGDGPVMSVQDVFARGVRCVWFRKGRIEEGILALASLKRIPDEHD